MKDPPVTRARERVRERGWLFNGRYSAIGGSDREIAFPADEARSYEQYAAANLLRFDEGKRVRRRRDTRKIGYDNED